MKISKLLLSVFVSVFFTTLSMGFDWDKSWTKEFKDGTIGQEFIAEKPGTGLLKEYTKLGIIQMEKGVKKGVYDGNKSDAKNLHKIKIDELLQKSLLEIRTILKLTKAV